MKTRVLWLVVMLVACCGMVQAMTTTEQQQGSQTDVALLAGSGGSTSISLLSGQSQQNSNAAQQSQAIFNGSVDTGHWGMGLVELNVGNTQGQYASNWAILQNQGGVVNIGTASSGNASAAGCYTGVQSQSAVAPGKIGVQEQIVAVFSISASAAGPCNIAGLSQNCVEVQQVQTSVSAGGGCQPLPCQ